MCSAQPEGKYPMQSISSLTVSQPPTPHTLPTPSGTAAPKTLTLTPPATAAPSKLLFHLRMSSPLFLSVTVRTIPSNPPVQLSTNVSVSKTSW